LGDCNVACGGGGLNPPVMGPTGSPAQSTPGSSPASSAARSSPVAQLRVPQLQLRVHQQPSSERTTAAQPRLDLRLSFCLFKAVKRCASYAPSHSTQELKEMSLRWSRPRGAVAALACCTVYTPPCGIDDGLLLQPIDREELNDRPLGSGSSRKRFYISALLFITGPPRVSVQVPHTHKNATASSQRMHPSPKKKAGPL
jgi:hypothetical protein